MRRTAAALGLALLAGCAHGPEYARFEDVPYRLGAERTIWGPRAKLHVHLSVLEPEGPATRTPLVLLHPWGLNLTVWADVAPALAKDRRVLLLDLPGHGKTAKPNTPYPMKRLAAAALDAMDAAGIRRAYVMGNSLGGATTLEVAVQAPDRVAGMVLVAAPGGAILPEPVRRAAHGAANAAWLETLSDEGWFFGMVAIERSLSPTAARLRDDTIALRRSDAWPAWSRATIRILRTVADYHPDLSEIRAPALVVHGSGDLLITDTLNVALAEGLPAAERSRISGCGHLPEVECPGALLDRVRPWLSDQDRRPVAAVGR